VFAYGSLMWRPGFDFLERHNARLIGAHRALCVYSFVHRGTPEKPGLVFGLDRGGTCRGIVYRVARKHRDATIDYLRAREQVTMVYREAWRSVWIDGDAKRRVEALCYLVDRGAGSSGLIAMSERSREELATGRQIVIFPEGTRRPAGAEPRYKYGIARLYAAGNVPVLPVALNSGLFWRRRSWLRPPGTIVVEVLDPIMPGLDDESFMARLQHDIETATARLIAEANSG
jgi:gamma-glutamylcyclotransferase (GGCT)/AIG2-like uncharacterized protein YtfP